MTVLRIKGRPISCRAILFDKDGTLLDFMQLWGKWVETLLSLMEGYLFSIDIEKKMATLPSLLGIKYDEQGLMIDYDRTGPLAMGTEEEITSLLAWQLYEVGVPWDEGLKLVARFSSTAMVEVKKLRPAQPIVGICELLESCRNSGILLGVVTSDRTSEAVEHLGWVELSSYFKSMVGRDRVTHGKPDPEMVILACRELGVSPNEVVVIGDSNVDMRMGKAAGVMMTIGLGIEEGRSPYLHDADLIIQDYTSITVE